MRRFWEALLITTLFFAVLSLALPLSDQEAYYWAWSENLDWCYFDHPPLQAWITRLFSSVFGDTVAAVRLPVAIARLVGLWVFFKWARLRLGRDEAAVAATAVLASVFFVLHSILALPDAFLFPFAMLTLYSADRRRGFATGVALGFAALAKWTAAIYVPGVIAAFLMKREGKRDVRGLFVAGAVSFALQAPVLYWNAKHGWVSFLFHLQNRHKAWSDVPLSRIAANFAAFGASQLALGAFGATALVIMAWRHRRRQDDALSPLVYWVAPAFLIFGFSALRGELRAYWTAPAFFPLVVACVRSLRGDPRLAKLPARFAGCAYLACALLATALLLPVGAYVKPLTDRYKPYDLRHSPRGDLEGWTQWIEHLRTVEELDLESIAFYGTDLRVTAQAAFALKSADPNWISTASPHQNQYGMWAHPSPTRFKEAIFFGDNRYKHTPVFDHFCRSGARHWKTFEVRLHGELIKEIIWTRCRELAWDDPIAAGWR